MVIVIDELVFVALNMKMYHMSEFITFLTWWPAIDIWVLELNIPLQFEGVDFIVGFWKEHVFVMTLISDSPVFHMQEEYGTH